MSATHIVKSSPVQGFVNWGGVHPEVRALLPNVLDALDRWLAEGGVLPRHPLSTRNSIAWPGRERGPDGTACGFLLVLGSCAGGLNTVSEEFDGPGTATRHVSGVADNAPRDKFSIMLKREAESGRWIVVVEFLDGPAVVRRTGLLRLRREYSAKVAWKVWVCFTEMEASILVWSALQLSKLGLPAGEAFGTLSNCVMLLPLPEPLRTEGITGLLDDLAVRRAMRHPAGTLH